MFKWLLLDTLHLSDVYLSADALSANDTFGYWSYTEVGHRCPLCLSQMIQLHPQRMTASHPLFISEGLGDFVPTRLQLN